MHYSWNFYTQKNLIILKIKWFTCYDAWDRRVHGKCYSRKLTNVITCKPFYLQRDDNDDRPIT